MNEDLEMLLKELEKLKADQQALADLEAQCKAEIKSLLEGSGLDDYKSENYGTIRLQRRSQKYYGEEIEAMEDQLKVSKKLADDLGDYQIVGYKESIVYCPPKDIF
jgi:hypothetical protein